MRQTYFDFNEKTDYELLEWFNKQTNKFTNLKKNQPKANIDALSDEASIELKKRTQILLNNGAISGHTPSGKAYTAHTEMIESSKLVELFLDYIMYGKRPLYINFLEDGTTLLFDLTKMKKRPERQIFNNIYSQGYERKESGERYLLSLDDAIIYNKEGKKLYDRQG